MLHVAEHREDWSTFPRGQAPVFEPALARAPTYRFKQTTTAFASGSPSQLAPAIPSMCRLPVPFWQ
jgi:hypothetical protein